eukprot:COSAG05_NODE_1465_length_4804_cov_372.506270_3_plen_58_part_00
MVDNFLGLWGAGGVDPQRSRKQCALGLFLGAGGSSDLSYRTPPSSISDMGTDLDIET